MLEIIAKIILSGILYREPRGSKLFGSSTMGRVVWAGVTSLLIASGYEAMYFFLWLWLAAIFVEASDANYGPQPDSREGYSLLKMTLIGCMLLNPFFGLVHKFLYDIDNKLKKMPQIKGLRGHAEIAELINGTITAAAWYLFGFDFFRGVILELSEWLRAVS